MKKYFENKWIILGIIWVSCILITIWNIEWYRKILESPEFSPRSDSENVQSIKVLSFGNEFREVMAVRVNQEKFRKGIA